MGLLTGKYSKQSLASLDETLVTSSKTTLELKDLKGYADEMAPLLEEMEKNCETKNQNYCSSCFELCHVQGCNSYPRSKNGCAVQGQCWRNGLAVDKEG
eukprot:1169028_1